MADVVVLLHFGGPESSDEVEPFLRRIFEDPLIIRAPLGQRFRRWLAGRIARKRAPETDSQYREIGYSPINRYTRAQAEHLKQLIVKQRPESKVLVANRYTRPFPDEILNDIDFQKDRIFLLTLYPHFCHSTSASSIRDFDLVVKQKIGNDVRFGTRIYSWWYHSRFLEYSRALLESGLHEAFKQSDGPITVLFSAHGIPCKYADRGDPYPNEIHEHYTRLREWGEGWLQTSEYQNRTCHWLLSFQSRVGPVEWIRPYTEDIIKKHGKQSGGHLLLVPISFVSDHIETLYEMDVTYRNEALAHGFSSYSRVQSPNDNPELAACLFEVLKQHGF